MTHVCNYASRWRATLCRRLVEEGERYCHQHRKRKMPVSNDEGQRLAAEYNARQRAQEGRAW